MEKFEDIQKNNTENILDLPEIKKDLPFKERLNELFKKMF